jgi:23S rRNA pseudouridine1911/1915/1917 synthase
MYERTFEVGEAEARTRLDRFLEERLPGVSRTYLRRAIRDGDVTVDGEVWSAGMRLWAGHRVRLTAPAEPVTAMLPEAIPLAVLYEDDTILVVDKPAGMLAHPTATVHSGTLANALAHYLNAGRTDEDPAVRPGLVHRLDRMTSGLMVVARTARAHDRMSRTFRERRVEKRYRALVCGHPAAAEGTIDAPIGHDPEASPRWGVRPSGRDARTRFAVVKLHGPYALVELEPLTGRTNQLRIHAAHAGWPIAGDTVHGLDRAGRFRASHPDVPTPDRLFLHACGLAFAHPETGAWLEIACPLPPELDRFLAALP